MTPAQEQELKQAATYVIQAVEESKNIGTGLYTLSSLLESHSKNGGNLDEAQVDGLAVILDALSKEITDAVFVSFDSIKILKNYSGGEAM